MSNDPSEEPQKPAASRKRAPRIGRREFIKTVGGAAVLGGGGRLQAGIGAAHARARAQDDVSPPLAKFVDPLPIPGLMAPVQVIHGVSVFDVQMRESLQKLHRDLPPTLVWGYNGVYPGPTFNVRRGSPIAVRWRNSLPLVHRLPVDPTIHGAQPPAPQVRTVVHLHGGTVLPQDDGYPEAWFTNGFAHTGPFFASQIYNYPNDQPPATLWYHDHALGITRLNVYMGLAGFYLIRDPVEQQLNLPAGAFDIPLLIQDRSFHPDGSFSYPVQDEHDPDHRVPPIWVPEFFGDTVLVNGKVWPFFQVQPRKYRFRILNGSNARFYKLALANAAAANGSVPVFHQIGTDRGFLPAPLTMGEMLIAPSERFDVIIDFAGRQGQSFVLTNSANAPFPDGGDVVPGEVMLFRVSQRPVADHSSLPKRLPGFVQLDPASAAHVRDMALLEFDSAAGNPIIDLINQRWDAPVTETPRLNSVEIWRLINTTSDAHPIHVHLIQFQVLDRQPFDTDQYPGQLVFTGPKMPPAANERPAVKDTAIAYPGEVTRIIGKFILPSSARVKPGERFRYVYHCHIVEHEDNEMMRPFEVVS
jgi:spore coat protein A